MVYVKNTERNHFRGFRFSITLKVIPVVGPHISVGADKMTFKINGSKVELTKSNHIKPKNSHQIGNTLLNKVILQQYGSVCRIKTITALLK